MSDAAAITEWEQSQIRTYTHWVNYNLDEKHQITDITKELGDSDVLISLIEKLAGKTFYSHKPAVAKSKIFKINNCTKAIEVMHKEGVNADISAENIVDGEQKYILGMVWMMILKYKINNVPKSDESSGKQAAAPVDAALLDWVNSLSDVKVTNFSSDWSSGEAFVALTGAVSFGEIDVNEFDGLSPHDKIEKCQQAAQEKLNIPVLMDVQDLACEKPDPKSVMTYISVYKEKYPALQQAHEDKIKQQQENEEAEKKRLADEEEERKEAERFAAEQAEKARIAAEEAERKRIAEEEAEKARIAAEEAEKARLAAEEAERLRKEKEEAERLAAEEAERARIQAEEAEKARLAAEELERQRQAAQEESERQRIAAEQAEQARIAAEQAEKARIAAEEAEKARLAAEEAEKQRIAAEQAERDRIAAQEAERQRMIAEEQERQRLAAIEAERLARERSSRPQFFAIQEAVDQWVAETVKAAVAANPRLQFQWWFPLVLTLTGNDYRELQAWFKKIDKDKSGTLELDELLKAKWPKDMKINSETTKRLMMIFDAGCTGSIGFFEFVALYNWVKLCFATFNRFDKDNSDSLSLDEAQEALPYLGFSLNKKNTNTLIKLNKNLFGKKKLNKVQFCCAVSYLAQCRTIYQLTFDTPAVDLDKVEFDKFVNLVLSLAD
ncbi:grainin, putative [Entamoeba invadens IP1]|uniref:grainin, putative n=1 Tax=Entamoeba invadens IP1 TaxID=370355 RepID=UPI0002C3E483|nr:grainin, putative [Entamoeba invadens IP1]ELP93463.1 grainin, putative [Entamoeba invadens IP1]|eukprot:XP_004260234.1 grainin, putative [Entamoeba invadens IP1]